MIGGPNFADTRNSWCVVGSATLEDGPRLREVLPSVLVVRPDAQRRLGLRRSGVE